MKKSKRQCAVEGCEELTRYDHYSQCNHHIREGAERAKRAFERKHGPLPNIDPERMMGR